jgi:hypothetical protein
MRFVDSVFKVESRAVTKITGANAPFISVTLFTLFSSALAQSLVACPGNAQKNLKQLKPAVYKTSVCEAV